MNQAQDKRTYGVSNPVSLIQVRLEEKIALEMKLAKQRLGAPDMTEIKSIMHSQQCTYKEAKEMYKINQEQAKTQELLA